MMLNFQKWYSPKGLGTAARCNPRDYLPAWRDSQRSRKHARALLQVTTKIAQIQKDTLHRQIPKNTSLRLLVRDWKEGHKEGGHWINRNQGYSTDEEETIERKTERVFLKQQKQKMVASKLLGSLEDLSSLAGGVGGRNIGEDSPLEKMVFRHRKSVDLSSHKEIRPSDLNHDKHGLPLWTAAALLQPSLVADMGLVQGEGFLAQTRS
mmetsp:Transcript_8840/g.15192  ORF Transcript_8840/g.15192 Transcript_8840/m.15192 type:complete len:208 (-) Transcript_8840:329-952(-)